MGKKTIHNINASGFKAPNDYFKDLEDNLLTEVKLRALTSGSGFKIPEPYFESIENKIIDKTSTQSTPKAIPLFTKQNFIYASGIAAAVLLLLTFTLFNSKPKWDSLDVETVENYIIDENISAYEIAALLLEEDLKEEDFVNYNFKTENIETYLLDNLDVEDLIIEY